MRRRHTAREHALLLFDLQGPQEVGFSRTSRARERTIGAVALQSCNRMSRRMMATPFFHIPIAPQSQAQADTDEEGVRET